MDYLIHIGVLICISGILALSLNLVVGETGLVSVAHAAFYGIGAYVAALLLTKVGLNFFLAALVGMAFSGFAALAIGAVLARFKGDFYVLVSLGFNMIIYSIMVNWQSVTNGPLGISAIPRPAIFGYVFGTTGPYFLLAAIALALTYYFCVLLTQSSFGRVLHGIREDEEATSVFGYRTTHYKVLIYMISAMLAGLAGALFASYITFIDPSSFVISASIFILAIVILGGLSSHRGVVLGAAILIALPEALRFVGFPSEIAAQMRQLTYGLILILLMLYRPQGLLGKFKL
ncbi:branched-chain amino acid ABC transporter permease [Candidatus Kaiserbacteria bacterium RIFCSPHIGHO2_01_FULL_55_37]|nr:MAG: branched-chain amino acid ABC transporter permease [Candidatus Kaiserbacteria bacterium RIFCSPHIGHO2_01_FULL_55_37]